MHELSSNIDNWNPRAMVSNYIIHTCRPKWSKTEAPHRETTNKWPEAQSNPIYCNWINVQHESKWPWIMRTCTGIIFFHTDSKLLRIFKILQMEIEGLLAVRQSIGDKKIDLPTIAMPTFPKCRRQTLLRRWSDMYNLTDTVKAHVGIHWWTIGCIPPNLHNWEPG